MSDQLDRENLVKAEFQTNFLYEIKLKFYLTHLKTNVSWLVRWTETYFKITRSNNSLSKGNKSKRNRSVFGKIFSPDVPFFLAYKSDRSESEIEKEFSIESVVELRWVAF